MPAFNDNADLAANANLNVVAGEDIEFIPPNVVGRLTFAETAEAIGMESQIQVGSTVVRQRGGVSVANRVPLLDDILLSNVLAAPSSRLSYRFYNTTAGALFWFAKIDCELVNPRRV